MRDRRRALRGDRRFGKKMGIWCLAMVVILALLVANLLHHVDPKDAADVPLTALKAAYARVVPGETAVPDLSRLGFDTGQGGVRRLSYLGLMENFAPRES